MKFAARLMVLVMLCVTLFGGTVFSETGGASKAGGSIPEIGLVSTASDKKYEIVVDGNPDDWKDIPYLTKGTGVLKNFYAVSNGRSLYILITGDNVGIEGTASYVEIDIDNNPKTGYVSLNWKDAGMDFIIENGTVLSHPENNGDWSWTEVGQADAFERSANAVEMEIDLKMLNYSGSAMALGYLADDASLAPARDEKLALLSVSAKPAEVVEAKPLTEWKNVKNLADGTGYVTKLFAVHRDNKLYLRAEGEGRMDEKGSFYIDADFDNSTGYHSPDWLNCGIDYKLEGNMLNSYSGEGADDSWDEVGTVKISKGTKSVDVEIPLDSLGLQSSALPIRIGYVLKSESQAPAKGKVMVDMGSLAGVTSTAKADVIAKFEVVPNGVGLAIDDMGWQGGKELWNETPDGPTRLMVNRDPSMNDYKTVVNIARLANTRPMGAFITSELDKGRILANPKYNQPQANFNITEYGTKWTNRNYAGTVALRNKIDELMDFVEASAAAFEFGMHGIRHERFVDGKQFSSEWGPVIDDPSQVPPPFTKEELILKADAYEQLIRQFYTEEESSFPKTMVPPRHGWLYDTANGITAGEILHQYGVKYANGDTGISTELGDGGIDNGVLFMNRQYGASFYGIGATPNEMPMEYGKYSWVESHFPNLWDAEDKWVAYLKQINNYPTRYLVRNTEQLASQWLYMQNTPITYQDDGKTFKIDVTEMNDDAYKYDLLGTLVLKTPLYGKHISSASITADDSSFKPQIVGSYEDEFGYGYLEIADAANTMGRLGKTVYTLECTLGDTYMPAYVDLTKGTYNVYSFEASDMSASIKVNMYGTQDIKIKLPFAPKVVPVSSSNNLKVNKWSYKNGYCVINVTGKNIQGEVGTITIN